jgi:hypothetical protein
LADGLAQGSPPHPGGFLDALLATGTGLGEALATVAIACPWEDVGPVWRARVRALTSGPELAEALWAIGERKPEVASWALEDLPAGLQLQGNLTLREAPWVVRFPYGLKVERRVVLSGCRSLLALPPGLQAQACYADGCPWVDEAPPTADTQVKRPLGLEKRTARRGPVTDGHPDGFLPVEFMGPAGDPLALLPEAEGAYAALRATGLDPLAAVADLAKGGAFSPRVLGRLAEPWLRDLNARDTFNASLLEVTADSNHLGIGLRNLAQAAGGPVAQAALDRLGWLKVPVDFHIPTLPVDFKLLGMDDLDNAGIKDLETWLVRLPPGLNIGRRLHLLNHRGLTALPEGLATEEGMRIKGCPALTRVPPGLALGQVVVDDLADGGAAPFVAAYLKAGHPPGELHFTGRTQSDMHALLGLIVQAQGGTP